MVLGCKKLIAVIKKEMVNALALQTLCCVAHAVSSGLNLIPNHFQSPLCLSLLNWNKIWSRTITQTLLCLVWFCLICTAVIQGVISDQRKRISSVYDVVETREGLSGVARPLRWGFPRPLASGCLTLQAWSGSVPDWLLVLWCCIMLKR